MPGKWGARAGRAPPRSANGKSRSEKGRPEHIFQPLTASIRIHDDIIYFPVADPGFPRVGAPTLGPGGTNLLFGIIFPENCMKVKIFGRKRGARHPQIRHCFHKSYWLRKLSLCHYPVTVFCFDFISNSVRTIW